MSKTTNALIALGVVAGLGAAALPLSSYAITDPTTSVVNGQGGDTADDKVSQTVPVSLKIDDLLSIETDMEETGVELKTTGSTVAGLYTGSPLTVNVKTNNSKGYKLEIAAGTAKNGGAATSLTNEYKDEITAGADFTDTTASHWGYYVGTTVETGQTWLAITEAGAQVGTKATATVEDGDDYTINFGANVIDGQAAGTYEAEVVLTATNNPNTNE